MNVKTAIYLQHLTKHLLPNNTKPSAIAKVLNLSLSNSYLPTRSLAHHYQTMISWIIYTRILIQKHLVGMSLSSKLISRRSQGRSSNLLRRVRRGMRKHIQVMKMSFRLRYLILNLVIWSRRNQFLRSQVLTQFRVLWCPSKIWNDRSSRILNYFSRSKGRWKRLTHLDIQPGSHSSVQWKSNLNETTKKNFTNHSNSHWRQNSTKASNFTSPQLRPQTSLSKAKSLAEAPKYPRPVKRCVKNSLKI